MAEIPSLTVISSSEGYFFKYSGSAQGALKVSKPNGEISIVGMDIRKL